MSWKHGIQTSKRTDSLIGLTGLFGLLALGTCLAANSPVHPAATAGDGQENSFSSAEEFAHKNFLKMGYSCGSAKYHDDKKCGYSLTQPAAAATPMETEEYIVARGAVMMAAYHKYCATLPLWLQAATGAEMNKISRSTVSAATDEVNNALAAFGAAKFCSTYQMDVARMVSGR